MHTVTKNRNDLLYGISISCMGFPYLKMPRILLLKIDMTHHIGVQQTHFEIFRNSQ